MYLCVNKNFRFEVSENIKNIKLYWQNENIYCYVYIIELNKSIKNKILQQSRY